LRVQQGAKKKKPTATDHEDASHVLGIISSLFTNLASEAPPRVRLLTKFVEENYEKADKLLEIRGSASAKLKVADREISNERQVCAGYPIRRKLRSNVQTFLAAICR
jgi:beta-catenin-like protein 1